MSFFALYFKKICKSCISNEFTDLAPIENDILQWRDGFEKLST